MNATKEQLAFNTFWNSMDEHEGMDTEICENVFKDGYNAGRKQALEEVLALANDEKTNYCNYDFFEFRQSIERLLK